MNTYSEVSTFHLMVELLYNGQAEIISEVEHLEPFNIEDILNELRVRSDTNLDDDVEKWCSWFLLDCEEISDEKKATFKMIKENKGQTDYFVEKISNKNKE